MPKFENCRQSFEALRRDLPLQVLFEKVIYIWLGLPDFREGQVGKFGLKYKIPHFSRAFEGNMCKWSLNGWKALNYIFFDQKLPSVIKISEANWQKMHFETIF